jgi:hypothetical protein
MDSLKSMTGIDFFPGLPDEVESRLERQYNYSFYEKR